MPEKEKSLTINETYHSIQGESTWAGRPCVFVRLTFCDLRCNYCDTEYAFYAGKKQTLKEIVDTVAAFDCPLVEITGGEPLLQKNVLPLMSMLCDGSYTVLLETSGAHDISKVDPRVHRIMDLKTPGSGEVDKNLWSNIDHLTGRDEVKFVMGSREDYEWSRDKVQRYDLPSRCNAVLFSPIFGRIDPRQIVEWILADKLDVRFQLQMHKFIWSPTQRGVWAARGFVDGVILSGAKDLTLAALDTQIHCVIHPSLWAPSLRLGWQSRYRDGIVRAMRARLTKDFTFEAAQTLPCAPEGHKCRRVHGHSFKVEVSVEGDVDPKAGWVYDHAEISAAMKPLLQMLDHAYLNDIEGLENPTIEEMAQWFWKKLEPQCPGLCEIVVHETPTARCVYRGE